MRTVYILIYEEVVLSAVSSVLDLLNAANDLIASGRKNSKNGFQIELISEKIKNIKLSTTARMMCSKTIKDVKRADLVIIPPFNGGADVILSKNEGIVQWLRTLNPNKIEVASLCYGSYFLAEAGLLSGKEGTSHWMAIDDMQRRYPDIKFLSDAVITDYKGVYTSGGAFSSLNLILYLVEKFSGSEVAVQLSKQFSIDMDRVTQAYFAVFQGQRNHKDDQIHKAQSYIEKNYSRQISVEQIADDANMSRRNFIRRFKDATRNNPLEYIQRVRIESAKKRIEKGERDVLSIMYYVGYNDIKTFRFIFKRITGITPQDYAKKYNSARRR
jgi:transcriptional regulator GlxA family with amidase domain